jgi:hypothetical protein
MSMEIMGHRFPTAAYAPKAIRSRILLIASERGLPEADVNRAIKASVSRGSYLVDFAKAHRIHLDWLFFGDLRGLRWMKRVAPAIC